ncbi:MAG: alpha/beta fold hydrolase [Candidatus Hydrogenedentales bacterium]
MAEAAAACRESLVAQGLDPAGYTTRESAADVDALREALGVEKLSLWGTSYGTHLGMTVLRDFGENIDRAVFAGPEGPDHTLKLPSATQAQLEKVAALIEADDAWGPILPDVLGLIEHTLAELRSEPRSVSLGSRTVVLGALDLQAYLANEIGTRGGIGALPVMLEDLQEGDFRRLAGFAVSLRNRPLGSAMSGLMDCASGASEQRLARIQREVNATLLGDAVNIPYMEVCEGWDAGVLGEDFRGGITSDVPVLFISGTLDGRTPTANVEELLPGFNNGHHLLVENAGHDEHLFSLTPGLADAMVAFFRSETDLPARVTAPPVEFILPRR